MEQIRSCDYAGRYAMERRKVCLIRALFDKAKPQGGLCFQIEALFQRTEGR